MRGFQMQTKRKAHATGYAGGGMVRGPGTGISDDVPDQVPEGTYIMPADSTAQLGPDKLAGMGARGFKAGGKKAAGGKSVPVNLSNGEFKMPPEQVHAVGVQALEQMKNATHTPAAQQAGEPEMFFANGGAVFGSRGLEGLKAMIPKVEAFKSLAQAFAAKAGVQAEKARVGIARYSALAQANAAQWDGYRARIGAESARLDALAKHSGVLVDGYKIAATATAAKAELSARMWEASVKQYESSQSLMLQSSKINMDAMVHANNARLEAAKVGSQIYAQQVASAFNIVNTSASISGSASMSQVAQV